MTAEIHTLVGAYALDAVDDLERAAFDRHLRDCAACRAELADFRETLARLAGSTGLVLPASFKERVLAEAATTRQVAPPVKARLRRSGSLRLRLTAAAAAVVAAATAGTAVFVVQEDRVRQDQSLVSTSSRMRTVFLAPDLVVREEPLTTGGHITVAMSRLQNAGVILLAVPAAPAGGRVIEAWAIGERGPAAAGTGRTSVSHIVENLSAVFAVAVTIEPAPGGARPTGHRIGRVELT
jgi:hypothetical protein